MPEWLVQVDKWLLSSVYQPATDAVRARLGVNAHWLSAGTAMFMGLVIAMHTGGILLALLLRESKTMLVLLVFVDLWWLSMCRYHVVAQVRLARKLDSQDVMGRHAFRNAEVLHGEPRRIGWVVAVSFFFIMDALRVTDVDFVDLGFLCWMSSLYFAACMTHPGKRRRQGVGFLSRFAAPAAT